MHRITDTAEVTFTLRVVRSRTVEREPEPTEFDDADETPSLPGMRVYTTDGEEVTQARPLAKCGPVRDERKKAAR